MLSKAAKVLSGVLETCQCNTAFMDFSGHMILGKQDLLVPAQAVKQHNLY